MTTKFNVFIACFGLLFITSCAPKLSNNKTSQKSVFYPPIPDTARVQFLTGFSSSEVFKMKSKFEQSITGKQELVSINKPYGISVFNNEIVVSDVGCVCLKIVDLNKNVLEYFRPENRKMGIILNTFIDTNSDLYILDTYKKNVLIYDANRKYVSEFSLPNTVRPTDIFVNDKKIFVTDFKNNRVNVYDKSTKKLIQTLPEEMIYGNEDYLYQPLEIKLSENYIYITDAGDFKIKVFDMDGKYIRSVGSFGTGVGQFARPKGIAVDKKENLFVVDASFENVQMFNDKGELLMYFAEKRKEGGNLELPVSIAIDYENLDYYQKYVNPKYNLDYLIFVTNQFGNNKVNVYGRVTLKQESVLDN